MAGSIARRGGAIAEINVTPLVDVVLVLLIIFMVVADLIDDRKDTSSIPMDLPEAATGDPRDRTAEPLEVAVLADGGLAVREVTVAADRDVAHHRVVALLALLRADGVTRLAIQTNTPEG